ncbi:type VII secretion-associated serine protease mycosin [Kribbella sp.]|uniref:type VII secretion-associated serine protease mycosin n=1 Tax=Kribbella sp. TaxID=1871183 RepID=UPI002D58D8CC|nr:type VII secretion-associated serine protease mycosin [Kribbella sp.]HZX06370.1 type VII secretion-associated serine protease mycosin [Kribbella sp.]
MTVRAGRLTAATAGALLVGLPTITSAPAASAVPPAGMCQYAEAGGTPVSKLPWAQTWLAPDRVPAGITGRGVTVAVIDSGVDADHPQLSAPGAVLPGRDLLTPGDTRANFDCVSHGTAVAGIIAARPAQGIGFRGIAPGATILPIRVSERDASQDQGDAVSPTVFAGAIRYAVDAGASVINISLSMYGDQKPVRDAVRYAEQHDALIVAAAGNAHAQQGADPITYPAAYPGVLGVGAMTIDGTRLQNSQVGSYVDISAPGGGVLSATRVRGHRYYDGTSFAAAFVSGTAALVRSADPHLSAAQVANRLIATATPAAGPADQFGAGVVNPYRAVQDVLATAKPAVLPRVRPAKVDPIADRRILARTAAGREGRRIALLAAVLAALVVVVAIVVPLGRRRNWRA